MLSDLRKNRTLLLMALPGVLLLIVFSYLPMIGSLIAFQDYRPARGIFGSEWIGFENFRFLFSTGDAWKLTFRTMGYNAAFIAFDQIAGLAIALCLNEVRNRLVSRTYQSLLFIPFFLSWVVVSYLSFAILKTDGGALNNALESLGGRPVRWYGTPEYWPPLLVLINFWKNVGLSVTIYLAGMIAINPEYYDAAKVDGAHKLQQIRYVTLPLLVPLIIIIVLLGMGRILRADFGLFYNVPQNSSQLFSVTDVLDTYVFRSLRVQGNVGMASAAGFYQSIVSFILVIVANWTIRRIDPDRALF
jgi:putative aldouronate transport system permease protein